MFAGDGWGNLHLASKNLKNVQQLSFELQSQTLKHNPKHVNNFGYLKIIGEQILIYDVAEQLIECFGNSLTN